MGMDFHPFFYRMRAGGNQVVAPFYLYHTDATGARWRKCLHVAQRWHGDTAAPKRLQYRVAFARFYRLLVYFYIKYHEFSALLL
jgi:hypothetical protein